MKKLMITMVFALIASVNVMAMSKSRSRQEASFLTDKMAYELHLTPNQMQDVYEISYDYFRALGSVYTSYSREYDEWYTSLSYILSAWQWRQLHRLDYFLTPVTVVNRAWYLPVYGRYAKGVTYYSAPTSWRTYVGGHRRNVNYYQSRSQMHRQEVHAHTGIQMSNHVNDLNMRNQLARPQANGHAQQNNGIHAPQNSNVVRPQNNDGKVQNGNQKIQRGSSTTRTTTTVTENRRNKVTDSTQRRTSRSDLHNQRTTTRVK